MSTDQLELTACRREARQARQTEALEAPSKAEALVET